MIVVVLMADVMVVTVVMVVAVVMRMTAIMIVIMALIVTVIMVMAVIMIVIVAAIIVMVVVMLFEGGFQVLGKGLFGSAIDLADGDSTFGRDLRARLEFRREQWSFAMSPAELPVQLADRSFDDARLPSTLRALHQRAANPERRRFGEDDVFHPIQIGRATEDAQQHAGGGSSSFESTS